MPEIEITTEQEQRLRALQEEIAADVVGKYGHVRPRDAVEYLLDRYAADASADADGNVPSAAESGDSPDDGTSTGTVPDGDASGTEARVVDEATTTATDDDSTTGDDDSMLNEMMSLLDTHDDKWGESEGDERYAVDLPDGGTEQVRTKDDVKALLFEHYR
jgi:hypothetical protein